jgi:hypothetical protein
MLEYCQPCTTVLALISKKTINVINGCKESFSQWAGQPAARIADMTISFFCDCGWNSSAQDASG